MIPTSIGSAGTVEAAPVHIPGSARADGTQWIHLLPLGRLRTKDGRGPFEVLDAPSIITASFQQADTTAGQIAVDYNHAIDKGEHDAPAAGWISAMEVRADGIWGLVRWTGRALNQVKEREFRFLSPVIRHDRQGKVRSIQRASLTNDPNLYLVALNEVEKGQSMPLDELLLKLRDALGLAETADAGAVLEEVQKLTQARHSVDPARYVPIETFEATLSELRKVHSGITREKAEKAVDDAIDNSTLLPFMREWGVSLCTVNKPAFDEFVSRMGRPMTSIFGPSGLNVAAMDKQIKRAADDEVTAKLGLSSDDVAKYSPKETN